MTNLLDVVDSGEAEAYQQALEEARQKDFSAECADVVTVARQQATSLAVILGAVEGQVAFLEENISSGSVQLNQRATTQLAALKRQMNEIASEFAEPGVPEELHQTRVLGPDYDEGISGFQRRQEKVIELARATIRLFRLNRELASYPLHPLIEQLGQAARQVQQMEW